MPSDHAASTLPRVPHDSPAAPAAPGAVAASTVRGLRREAYRLLRSDARRAHFPSVLHVGRLDRWPAEVLACEVPRVVPPGLATDVVTALLLDRDSPAGADVWLTRPGDPAPDHLDLVWSRALGSVAESWGLHRPRLFVVTRTGWQLVVPEGSATAPGSPGAGEGQRWRRLRLVLPDS